MCTEVAFAFVQVGRGKQKATVGDVKDYELENRTLTIEHSSGPDTIFNQVLRLDAAYRGDDPESDPPASGQKISEAGTEYER